MEPRPYPRRRAPSHAEIPSRAQELIPAGTPVVVYSWGPGCNGSTFAAPAFATLGYRVREMIGGIEYWARNGLPVQTADGVRTGEADRLVTAHQPPPPASLVQGD